MYPKLIGSSRLPVERRLHIFERRLEQELKDQYHYFMRKSKGLDHRDPVNSQEGTKHATVYQLASLRGNKFHDNARTTMESNIDNFQVKNNTTQVQPTDSTATTNRKVLATTASIFEPLGLLSPAVIVYKIFLQNLWQDKLQRGELLPAHLQQEIHKQLLKSQGQQAINYPFHKISTRLQLAV